MSENVTFPRKQEKFLQALSLGESIVAAAKHAGITEKTAYRWLKEPLVREEHERRKAALAEAEQAAIAQILTSGYALMHKRVEALGKLATKLEGYLEDEQKVWLSDVKSVGSGPTAERVDLVTFNDALISEYRATFDDLAKELGQRVKKTKQEITGKDGAPIQVHVFLPGDEE